LSVLCQNCFIKKLPKNLNEFNPNKTKFKLIVLFWQFFRIKLFFSIQTSTNDKKLVNKSTRINLSIPNSSNEILTTIILIWKSQSEIQKTKPPSARNKSAILT